MCAQVYGVVYRDPSPKINGRKGQTQGGVDVFVNASGIGRIGIQCKKYFRSVLKWEHVTDEVGKADKAKTPIRRLLIATTSPSDSALLHEVQLLSDRREAEGLFTVEVEFWEDIENRIESHAVLQDSYVPHSPGAAYHRQEQQLMAMHAVVVETRDAVVNAASLPVAREDSVNKVISSQLDHTNELLKNDHYQDALAHVGAIGTDLGPFDEHQKARWHLQRGLCLWFSRDDIQEAATHFLKAADLYPDDERMAAAGVRGRMMKDEVGAALAAGQLAVERFPASQQVWLTNVNVKMLNGEKVALEDFPSSMRTEPDVLQMAALAARGQGDMSLALKLSQQAAAHPEARFFTRAATLRLAVESAARSPVAAMHGLLPDAVLEAIRSATALFDPRLERLWGIQSGAVQETAAHLGYAFLLQRRNQEALDVALEAEVHGIRSRELLRVHVHALSELNRVNDALELGRARLDELNAEALVAVCELAAKQGDVALLERALESVKAWSPPDQETVDIITALRWSALSRAGDRERAINEILAAQLEVKGSFILICAAARMLGKADRRLEAADLIGKAKSLVNHASSDSKKLMLAELLFTAERWTEAAALFEALAPAGKLSELHNRILACYVNTESRKKAKDLLSSFPDGWAENDATRQLAIDLGQSAGDWQFLRPLAEAQLQKAPTRAVSWLFKLHVEFHLQTPAALQDLVRRVPAELSGSVRNLAQLASLELRYDEAARGMRRLYRLVRENYDDPEAFSAYFIGIVAARHDLPMMDDVMPSVVAGSSVTLLDEYGQEQRIIIDPPDVGALPKRDGFISYGSSEATALLGALPDQVVEMPGKAFGGARKFTVKAVQSPYRRMLHIAEQKAHTLSGLPHMKSVAVGRSGEPAKDFAQVHAEIQRSNSITKQIFDAYATGSLTLGGFCHMQGRSAIDVVTGWPSDGPPLFVGTGIAEEREQAMQALQASDTNYVTDALTIAEIVNLDAFDILAALPKLYISPTTVQVLEDFLREAESDESFGTAVDIDGKLAFIEYDDTYRRRRLKFARAMLEVVAKYCIAQPAYGDLAPPAEYAQITDILQAEEREVLLLAKEHGGTLLTLDGRLRVLARLVLDVSGIWPQALLMHCLATGRVTAWQSAEMTSKQFLNNRSFMSLAPHDLVWMVMQGGGYLQRGLLLFKRYLESPESEFESTTRVAFHFLATVARLLTHLDAFGEILIHIVEATLRRKGSPSGFLDAVTAFVNDLPIELAGAEHLYPIANAARASRIRIQRRYLAECVAEARELAAAPQNGRPVAVRVLYCSKVPWIVFEKATELGAPVEQERTGSSSENLVAIEHKKEQPAGPEATATPKAYLVAQPQSSGAPARKERGQ